MDIAAWLQGLGFARYVPAFRDNEIDWEVLPKLTSEDLREIGVAAIGHRRKLLDAIAALGATMPTAAVTAAPSDAPAPTDAERRQLTVIFCDLVGSTPLSTRFDPEDLREVIGAYHRCVAGTVGRFAGFVAKYMGDGVLVYFGYPEAHEDDAERAVRAGLAVIDAVARLTVSERLNVRLGIASGLVVVGDLIGAGAAQEHGVVGETPNLASRLQALAQPGTLVISESTRRQVGAFFEIEDLGAQPLAGFAEPQHVWRVVGESGVLSRFEALRSEATPLVGRDEELDLLLRRWQQAKVGEGRVVLLSGEPGIGKSRLTAALSERIESDPHTRLRYFCSPYHQDSALYPFITQLERAAGFARDDAVEQKLDKLRALLGPGAHGHEEIALLAELLSLSNTATDLNLSPQRKREMLFEALLHQLEAVAQSAPVLMVFEDAHWTDPSSRELLDLTAERIRSLPVLLVITFRPEFQPPWSGRSYVTSLALNRLGERDGEALVQTLAGNSALDAEIVAEIVERTDGVPLFVEELTKAVLESVAQGDRIVAVLGANPAATRSIPATLHASLMARLDRLGTAPKEVAQIGAVLGREFTYELIDQVARRPDLDAALGRLTDAGLLFCRGVAPHSSYLFKHALVQDAAYGTLLRGTRRQLHARIALVLEDRYPAVAEAQPELLAHHYTESADFTKALAFWLRAGQRAARGSANAEALAHLARGLELVKVMPDTPEVRQQEIRYLTTWAVVLRIAKGYASDELVAVLHRARDLCQRHGDPRRMFEILFGLWTASAGRGDWLGCRALGKECLAIAEEDGETGMLIEAHRLLGSTAVYMAEHRTAEQHLRQALALYEPEKHRANAFLYGYDPGTICEGYISWPLWLQGKMKEAFAASDASIGLAINSGHPSNIALAYGWAMFLHLCAQEIDALRTLTSKLLAICKENEFPHWLAVVKIGRGWWLARTGHPHDGIEQLQAGVEEFRSFAGGYLLPAWLVCLADALRIAGRFADARAALDSSLDMIERLNERLWEAENYRMQGEVARDEGDLSAALTAFSRAITVARRQSARSLELRGALAWAKVAGAQGRRAEARELLAPVYGWFTERFDTADLKEAKALLDELT